MTAILQLDGIDAFYGASHVLHGVSLMIEPGEAVLLIGRNGAGKTTTMHAIMGLVTPLIAALASDAQVFVFFIMVVAAAEVSVGLAIIVMLYRNTHSVDVNFLNRLKN